MREQDLNQLKDKGIALSEVERQLAFFEKETSFLPIISSASYENGIMKFPTAEQSKFLNIWEEYLKSDKKVVKFVPASGAASRMFKDLYAFLDSQENEPLKDSVKEFFDRIEDFAFYDALNHECITNTSSSINRLLAENRKKDIVRLLLTPEGLNYGNLPKGLLLFHKNNEKRITAAEEHLAEGAMYTKNASGDVNIHFTISPNHMIAFESLIFQKKEQYESTFSVQYNLSFSTQSPATDTIAVNPDNTPFRTEDGSLLFRPGGHGALINNLNNLEADVVFIKNIDNVVPDTFKCATLINKKLLGGILVNYQENIFKYIKLLKNGNYSKNDLEEIVNFVQNKFCITTPESLDTEEDLKNFLIEKLNRPIRVCGMVRNQGEPGGGPFIIREKDGSQSLQILESSQIDMNNPKAKASFEEGTHFNPVDLVCGIRNYQGEKFNLLDFVDPETAFISHKSKDGKELKALERPGLWNGAMSKWNTVFVEVPIETFNPVKTVNDLLRPEHQ